MNILCIGKSSWNISIPVEKFLEEGNNYIYNKSFGSGSGSGSSVAYLLAKWGVNAVIATMVGSDDYGSRIKKEFSDLSAKTDYIETSYDKNTNLEINFINDESKVKTGLAINGDNSVLKKYNYDFTPDFIYTDCFDYGASQNAFSRYTTATTIVGASALTAEVFEMCKYAKIIICNREFAEYVSKVKTSIDNPQSLVDAYNGVQVKYPHAQVIMSLDVNGVIYQKANEIKIMPGLNIEVVDRTGAGDAFKAAFIYSLVNKFDMDKSIIMANIAAGVTVSRMGARMSFPSLSEVIDLYNQKMGVPAQQQTSEPQPEVQQVQATQQPVQQVAAEQPAAQAPNAGQN